MTEAPLATSSATQAGVCDACGRALVIRFEQVAFPRFLRWSWSAACPSCGKSAGDEGAGTTPGEIRAALLAAEGEWALVVADSGNAAIPAIKALRTLYGLGLKEAKDVWDKDHFLRGTRAECEAVAALLRADGLSVDVAFAGAASPTPAAPPAALPPDDSRWVVAVRNASGVAISAIKAIRSTYGIGLKEAKDRWDARARGDVFPGTRSQCEALAAQMKAAGVECEIRPER